MLMFLMVMAQNKMENAFGDHDTMEMRSMTQAIWGVTYGVVQIQLVINMLLTYVTKR